MAQLSSMTLTRFTTAYSTQKQKPVDRQDNMKTIQIKQLTLLNFKGIRELTVLFEEGQTIVSGGNGTGKTSIFDAFTWLLFGKDSQNREKFEYKTLDNDGNIIPKLPHEVNGIIRVDGKDIRLMRRVNEKWDKRKGSMSEVFIGNEIERFYDDVPCSESEFKSRINDICPEETFKYITNPTYFCTQKSEVQKRKLLEMSGPISNADISTDGEDFSELIKALEEKDFDSLKREVTAKKNRLKSDMIGIPDRIDENKRKMPEEQDWESIEKELTSLTQKQAEVEDAILDVAKQKEDRDNQIKESYEEISGLRAAIARRELAINNEANKEYMEASQRQTRLKEAIVKAENEISNLSLTSETLKQTLSKLTERRETLRGEWRNLRLQMNNIDKTELVFNDADFVCPTCKRRFEESDIQSKIEELNTNFRAKKQARMELLNTQLNTNVTNGRAVKTQREEFEAKLNEIEEKSKAMQAHLTELKEQQAALPAIEQKDIAALIACDDGIVAYNARIEAIEKHIKSLHSSKDASQFTARRTEIVNRIAELKGVLRDKEVLTEIKGRISELERSYSTLASELSQHERFELLMTDFSKAKDRVIQQKIDGLFNKVRFRWIAMQINGKEKPTCEATIDGVPYQALNHAAQIDAGLDIINAICEREQVCAPIFIDNAESCNTFRQTKGQQILLTVTEEKQLNTNHSYK